MSREQRLEAAIETAVWHLHNGRDRQALAVLRAVLAESGNTDRCPTCYDSDTTRTEPPLVLGPMQSYSRCGDPWHRSSTCPTCGSHSPWWDGGDFDCSDAWHRATDTEGDE